MLIFTREKLYIKIDLGGKHFKGEYLIIDESLYGLKQAHLDGMKL